MRKLFVWIHQHETHLSAGAMVVGFIIDNIFFSRIDQPQTEVLLIGYLVTATISIGWWHYLEERTADGVTRSRWRSTLPILTQFALGGLWSAFIIFYSRSATLATSWPFLLILGGIFLGNEIFKKYHDRLTFNAVLYFFALYSYAIFAVPVFTHSVGTGTFLLSGVCAVTVFALFMVTLRLLGRFRYSGSIWSIRFWAGLVFLVINLFYFANILPPLPLALSAAGVYHSLERSGASYVVSVEPASWTASFGINPTIHVTADGALYVYSAIFAPVALNTKTIHLWQWYDPNIKKWVVQSTVSFPISGGREGGYRGYSIKKGFTAGDWRVDIETVDGRLIGRIGFTVVLVPTPIATKTLVL